MARLVWSLAVAAPWFLKLVLLVLPDPPSKICSSCKLPDPTLGSDFFYLVVRVGSGSASGSSLQKNLRRGGWLGSNDCPKSCHKAGQFLGQGHWANLKPEASIFPRLVTQRLLEEEAVQYGRVGNWVGRVFADRQRGTLRSRWPRMRPTACIYICGLFFVVRPPDN